MAAAKKCDICGKLYELYNVVKDQKETNGIMFLNIDQDGGYHDHNAIDCCPKCMESIKKHIEKLKGVG